MPCILQSVLCLPPGPLRPFAAATAALSPSDRAALGAIEVAVFEGRLGPGWSRTPIFLFHDRTFQFFLGNTCSVHSVHELYIFLRRGGLVLPFCASIEGVLGVVTCDTVSITCSQHQRCTRGFFFAFFDRLPPFSPQKFGG